MHGLPKWWRAVHAEDDYVRDFLLIALLTGMRRSEIARLRWEHIDLEGKTLTVRTTKNGDPLELPLSTFLYELLLTRREADPDAEWVFPGPGATGHIVETKKFYARVAKAKLDDQLAHTADALGVDVRQIEVEHLRMTRLVDTIRCHDLPKSGNGPGQGVRPKR